MGAGEEHGGYSKVLHRTGDGELAAPARFNGGREVCAILAFASFPVLRCPAAEVSVRCIAGSALTWVMAGELTGGGYEPPPRNGCA